MLVLGRLSFLSGDASLCLGQELESLNDPQIGHDCSAAEVYQRCSLGEKDLL